MKDLRLPIGIDSFEEIRSDKTIYYVDKTKLIEDLVNDAFKIMLFTRPRRFGKTLMMQTLYSFFDIRKDNKALFEGLYIEKNKELCDKWMNKYPVISVTFKDIAGIDFCYAYNMLKSIVSRVYQEHNYLLSSEKLSCEEKELVKRIIDKKATDDETDSALFTLTQLLNRHYGIPVIILIDEYDVPLAKADDNGYYNEMIAVIRNMFSQVIKTNPHLKFAVITGCLRVAHESIFTGANNFLCNTISNTDYSQYFGFTQKDVDELLECAHCSDSRETLKKWYDGYTFGRTEIYCPWDVINCVRALRVNPDNAFVGYWKNTSHNSIIRRFIDRADLSVGRKFETLINGGSITTKIVEDLSYDVLHSSEENLWSILYLTGYLTIAKEQKSTDEYQELRLVIPNEEIKIIYQETISQWFKDRMIASDRTELFNAFWDGDAEIATSKVSDLLFDTISYYDYNENYYHAFIAGIFAGSGYDVETNKEHGLGRPDIIITDTKTRSAIIIEIKHTRDYREIEAKAQEALKQIEDRKYVEGMPRAYKSIICYGAVFCDKECMIVKK